MSWYMRWVFSSRSSYTSNKPKAGVLRCGSCHQPTAEVLPSAPRLRAFRLLVERWSQKESFFAYACLAGVGACARL